jgi:outer membrane protein TolC
MKKLLLFFVLALSQIAMAQDAMTFGDCLNLALKNNLDVKTAEISEQIAHYQYRASYGKLLPVIYFELDDKNSWGREINPKTNLIIDQDIKNYVGMVEADYNLFAGFSAVNGVRAAKLSYKINQKDILKIKNAVTIDVAQKFITILYLQEITIANQAQITASEKQLELAQLKFNSGAISESEVFKIKSQKATEELNLLTNQNRLADNLISLKQLMNVSLEKEITLTKPELNLDKNALLEEDQYSLMKKAVVIHPSYAISQLKEEKAKAELAITCAMRYPVLSVRLQSRSNYTNVDQLNTINDQIDGNYLSVVRFNLQIPIFNQFQTFSRVKTSKLNYRQSIIDAEATQNRLSKEVLKAITDTKTAVKKNESSAIAFEFSQKSYEADELKFELGKININELNTTKSIYNSSQAELIQSKYELLFNNALIKFYLGQEFEL